MKIDYSIDRNIEPKEYFDLAETVGWGHDHPIGRNKQAINGSIFVASARYEGKLVGLLRLVGDGAYCLYIADFIVHTDYHRTGIGSVLLKMSIDYAREQAIGVDDDPGEFTLFANVAADRFYEKHGFVLVPNGMELAVSKKRRELGEKFVRQWSEERARSSRNIQ